MVNRKNGNYTKCKKEFGFQTLSCIAEKCILCVSGMLSEMQCYKHLQTEWEIGIKAIEFTSFQAMPKTEIFSPC